MSYSKYTPNRKYKPISEIDNDDYGISKRKAAEYLEDANWSDSYDVAEGATKHQKEGNDSNYNSNKQQARNRELELLLNLPRGSITGAAQYKSSNYQIISGPTGKFPGQT